MAIKISGSVLVAGSTTINETEFGYLDGLTAGTVAASKAVVVDANKDISGYRHVTAAGAVTAGTSFIIGSADLNEADMEKLDGITDGTVAANKAVVVDSNKDADGFRNISGSTTLEFSNGYFQRITTPEFAVEANGNTDIDGTLNVEGVPTFQAQSVHSAGATFNSAGLAACGAIAGATSVDGSGDLTMGTITMTGFSVDADGDTALKSLLVDDDSTIGCDSDTDLLTLSDGALVVAGTLQCNTSLTIGSAAMSEADLEKLDGITNGAGAANKALVLDASSDIASGLNSLTSTYLTASYAKIDKLDVNEINSITSTVSDLEVSDRRIIAALSASASNADGGGLRVGGGANTAGHMSVLWDNSNSAMDFNIGGTTEMRLQDGVLRPESDNDVDLGASGAEFKDLYLDGVAYIDTLNADALGANLDHANFNSTNVDIDSGAIDGTVIGASSPAVATFTTLSGSTMSVNGRCDVSGTFSAIGNSQFGNAASDVVTLTAQLTASEGATFSKAAAGPIFSASVGLYGDEMTVGGSGGTATFLNGATMSGHLGGTTATFSSNLTVQGASILSGAVSLGDASGDVITFNGRLAGDLVPNSNNAIDLGTSDNQFADLHLDGVAYIDELRADSLGAAMDCNSQTMTNVDINSGNIDGTVIGAASVAAGSFAAIVGTTATLSSTLTANGDVDLGNATSDTITCTGRFDSDLLPSSDSARDLGSSALQWAELHVDSGYVDTLAAAVTASAGLHVSAKTGPYAVSVADGAGDVIAQAFVTHSDRNLKTNIKEAASETCLNKVMKLQPTTYDKKATGKSEIGFIAQDVAKVAPEICALDATGEGRGIDYSRMSTLLVGALKAQQEQIAQLKEIVAKLQK